MRKILMAVAIAGTMAFSFSSCGGCDNVATARVPNDVIDEFYDRYPSAQNADWKMKDGLYEVEFEMGNKDMEATFSPDGDLVRAGS